MGGGEAYVYTGYCGVCWLRCLIAIQDPGCSMDMTAKDEGPHTGCGAIQGWLAHHMSVSQSSAALPITLQRGRKHMRPAGAD